MGERASELANEIARLRSAWTGRREQAAIADAICDAEGAVLVELKQRLDAVEGGDGLMNVVFDDLEDDTLQERVLEHLAIQARSLPRTLRLISDIDDTVVSSLHDARYPRGACYPASLQLYRAIDRQQLPVDTGEVVFLTARPDVGFGLVERLTLEHLKSLGVARACVLFGAARNLFGLARIAEGKHENLRAYAQLYPECDFLLVGDSGQGDVDFFRRALASHPGRIRAALIHDVIGLSASQQSALREQGIDTFETFLGAAVAALDRGLIGVQDAASLPEVAFEALDALALPDNDAQRARVAALRSDEARLRDALGLRIHAMRR